MNMRIAILSDGGAVAVSEALTQAGYEPLLHAPDAGLGAWLAEMEPAAALFAFEGARPAGLEELLELAGIPYVGASAAACRAAADLPLVAETTAAWHADAYGDAHWPRCVRITAAALACDAAGQALSMAVERIPGGYPLCVKGAHDAPATCNDFAELLDAVRAACERDGSADVVEPVEGARLAVTVLGEDDRSYALPPAALTSDGAWQAPADAALLAADPAEAEAIRAEVERAALEVHCACGCRDVSVVTVVWDGACAQVLGLDAAPSISGTGPIEASLAAAGIGLAPALDALLDTAIGRGSW